MAIALYRSKTTSESKPYSLNFVNALPIGVTVASATATATALTTRRVDNTVLQETVLASTDTTVLVRTIAGAPGETYLIKVQMLGSDGFLAEEVYLYLQIENVPLI